MLRSIATIEDWNELRQVADFCLYDAVECIAAIEIVEAGNQPEVVDALIRSKALRTAVYLRDAALFRLNIIVSRAFAVAARPDDRHLRTAIDFLRSRVDDEERAHYRSLLQEAVDGFDRLASDPRLATLIKMRNKRLAHFTKPDPNMKLATYRELFEVSREFAAVAHTLAAGVNLSSLSLDGHLDDHRSSMGRFWGRWSTATASPAR